MATYLEKSVVNLMFGMDDFDPVNARFLDRSGNNLHAAYTAGASAPTKLTDRHGISLDGNDLCVTPASSNLIPYDLCAFALMVSNFTPSLVAGDRIPIVYNNVTVGGFGIDLYTSAGLLKLLNVYYNGGAPVLSYSITANIYAFSPHTSIVVINNNGSMQMFVNGNSVATGASGGSISGSYGLSIGRAASGAICNVHQATYWTGMTLTQTQVKDWHIRAMQRVNAL